MNKSISNILTRHLVVTMTIGVCILLSISMIYSYVSFVDYRKDRLYTMETIAENIVPDIAKDVANQSLEALRIRMEFIVLKEQERNIQLKILDRQGEVIYESDEFDWRCNAEIKGFSDKVPLCLEKTLASSDGNLGKMLITRDVRTFFSFFLKSHMPVLFLILLAFLSLLVVMFRYLIRQEVIGPMNQLIRNLEENIAFDEKAIGKRAIEWSVLAQSIMEYKEKIINYIKKQNQMSRDLEKEKLVSEITAQLAHDIRSPLAALDMMASNLDELDHNKRTLIRNATTRIHNIAHNLLDRSFQKNNNISTQMFSSIIRSMLFEKREQYKSNPKISIHDHVSYNSYGAFAKIEINDFKRMLSNLIDNSVQAIVSTGFVRVALSQNDEFVVVEVFDNGKGIPSEEISKVTQKGYTKKASGSGLGLYFVYQKITEWGGRLEIDSSVGGGTSVKMIIRKEPPPAWFVSEIAMNDEDEYVVLDDDFTIHEMWKGKVLQALRRNVKMRHFENEKTFKQWFESDRDKTRKTTYFFDYELLGNKNSGLDIIEKYNINSNAILITSHYEDEDIQKRCAKIGVKMIPKEMAGFVPIVAQA